MGIAQRGCGIEGVGVWHRGYTAQWRVHDTEGMQHRGCMAYIRESDFCTGYTFPPTD